MNNVSDHMKEVVCLDEPKKNYHQSLPLLLALCAFKATFISFLFVCLVLRA